MREEYSQVAQRLLAAGAKLTLDAANTAAQLCECAEKGKLDRLDLMLQCNCDPNATDYDLRTPLHVAACSGHMHIVKHLVARGVHVDAKDRWGGTPIDDAKRGGFTHIFNFLTMRLEMVMRDISLRSDGMTSEKGIEGDINGRSSGKPPENQDIV